MDKIWQIADNISDNFAKENPEYSQVVLQLLWNREIKEKEKIKEFLRPNLDKQIHDPFLFRNMRAVVELVINHIKARNKIVVYGDYDADGVTASALMVDILSILRADVGIYIPHRVTEGYGLNKDAVEKIAQEGAKLIVTVDGGIRSQKEVEQVKDLGLDIVITDHHPPPEDKKDWPDCLVLNPILDTETYPYKYLSGVGVAYKLASAIITNSKLSQSDKGSLIERVLDLVAIGTVADCADLRGRE